MLTRYAPYVPRLLDQPWSGSRIAPGAFVFCEFVGLTGNGHAEAPGSVASVVHRVFVAAEPHGGDVLSFGGSAMTLLFTGDGRQGRAINAVHAMHDALGGSAPEVAMAAGIASGMVHLVTLGEGPRQLMSIGPTVTRAIELAALAGPGDTRSERIDNSAMSTQGKPVGWPAEDFIAPAVLSTLEADGEAPVSGDAVVAFAMFSGVDHALGRNPGRATEQVSAVVERVQRAAGAFDVTVLGNSAALGGGALLLTAGLNGDADDAEERMFMATKAALEGDPPLALRFGVATGPVVAGSIGASARRTYTVLGETVDLAARLAASAQPGEVLTTHRTIDRAATRYAVSEWEPVTFTSIGGSVVPVSVGRELGEEARAGGFVGRSSERAMLDQSLTALRDGHGGIVEIVGEAGIGKSRLVEEALRDSGLRTVAVRCDEYRRLTPYAAASQLLRGVMDIAADEDPKRAGMELRAQVRDLTPYLERWLPLLADVAGARVKSTAATRRVPAECRRVRTSAAASQLVAWLIKEPTVITVEDAQWMDDSSARLFSFALGSGLPCLVVATRRPGESGWTPGEMDRATRIELDPLAPGPTRALITELRRDDPPSTDELTRLVGSSGGNPMLIELLALPGGPDGELPADLVSAVQGRVALLEEASQAALRGASVLGTTFAPESAGELLRDVDWNSLGDFVEPVPGGMLRFRHGAVRESLVADLADETRRTFHAEAARNETDMSGAVVHFRRAGDHDQAWKRGMAAGSAALDSGSYDEAASLLRIAVAAGRHVERTSNKERAAAAELQGDAALRAGRIEDADSAYESALDLVRAGRDRARLMAKRAAVRERQGRYPAALRLLTTASKSLPKSAGPGDHAPLDYQYARVRMLQGKYPEAIERAERAIDLAERARDGLLAARARLLAGRAASVLDASRGVERIREAAAAFEALGEHRRLADALDRLAAEAHRDGRHGEALDLLERAMTAREVSGDVLGASRASYESALVLLDMGRLDEAAVALERVRSAARATMSRISTARASMRSAEIDARRGNTVLALGTLEQTLARFENLGADADAATNRLLQAETHLLGGAVEEALATADKALEATPGGITRIGLQRVRGIALVWIGRSRDGHLELMEALDAAQASRALVEEALISDALSTLYGDDDAADRRQELVERLGIVQLPPFLTIS